MQQLDLSHINLLTNHMTERDRSDDVADPFYLVVTTIPDHCNLISESDDVYIRPSGYYTIPVPMPTIRCVVFLTELTWLWCLSLLVYYPNVHTVAFDKSLSIKYKIKSNRDDELVFPNVHVLSFHKVKHLDVFDVAKIFPNVTVASLGVGACNKDLASKLPKLEHAILMFDTVNSECVNHDHFVIMIQELLEIKSLKMITIECAHYDPSFSDRVNRFKYVFDRATTIRILGLLSGADIHLNLKNIDLIVVDVPRTLKIKSINYSHDVTANAEDQATQNEVHDSLHAITKLFVNGKLYQPNQRNQ